MIDDEPYTLYNRVSLPRYLRGVLLEQRVYVRDMEWHTQNRIDCASKRRSTSELRREDVTPSRAGDPLRPPPHRDGRPAQPLRAPGAEGAPYLSTSSTSTTRRAGRRIRSPRSRRAGRLVHRYELTEAFAHAGSRRTG